MKKIIMFVLMIFCAIEMVSAQTITGDVAKVTMLFNEQNWSGVVDAANKVYADYGVDSLEKTWPTANIIYQKAWGLFNSGRKEEAVAFLKEREDNIDHPFRTMACIELIHMSRKLGKARDVHSHAVIYLTIAPSNFKGYTRIFDSVNPEFLGKDAYIKLLETLILKIPAIEENASFLGRLKSEIEKLK